jgi:hypothetical protein
MGNGVFKKAIYHFFEDETNAYILSDILVFLSASVF